MNLCRMRRDMVSRPSLQSRGAHVLSSLFECGHSFRITVVDSFAFGIVVMDESHETRSLPSSRPLQREICN